MNTPDLWPASFCSKRLKFFTDRAFCLIFLPFPPPKASVAVSPGWNSVGCDTDAPPCLGFREAKSKNRIKKVVKNVLVFPQQEKLSKNLCKRNESRRAPPCTGLYRNLLFILQRGPRETRLCRFPGLLLSLGWGRGSTLSKQAWERHGKHLEMS